MNAFIDLVKDIFPSTVDKFTAEEAKECLKQFRKENKFGNQSVGLGKEYDFFTKYSDDILRQGDILDKVPFLYINTKGEQKRLITKGMILSNTCDLSRDEYIHIAPLIEIEDLIKVVDEEKRVNYKKDLIDNRIFRFLYLPHNCLKDYVVNFHLITSFPRGLMVNKIESKEINVENSLNQIGFYFLLCKLTVYFMREENPK